MVECAAEVPLLVASLPLQALVLEQVAAVVAAVASFLWALAPCHSFVSRDKNSCPQRSNVASFTKHSSDDMSKHLFKHPPSVWQHATVAGRLIILIPVFVAHVAAAAVERPCEWD